MKVTFTRNAIFNGSVRLKGTEVEVSEEVAKSLAKNGFVDQKVEKPKTDTKKSAK